jgi:hypothetical protein
LNHKIDNQIVTSIRELYATDDDIRRLFDWTASLRRDATETNVLRLCSTLNISRAAGIQVFKKLEKAGCGRFVVGRHSHPTRFEWFFSRVSLGRAAAGEAVDVAGISNPIDEDDTFDTPLSIREARQAISARLGLEPEDITIIVGAVTVDQAKAMMARTMGVDAARIRIEVEPVAQAA